MDVADGRKADLFDTSSHSEQADLFDSRKRKATAMESPDHRGYEHYAPPPYHQQKHYYPPSLDLGAMLRGDHISKENYHRIQALLKEQDRRIKNLLKEVEECEQRAADRGLEINKRCTQIGDLKHRNEVLEKENARLKGDEKSLKRLREVKDQLKDELKKKDDYISMGTMAVKDKTEAANKLESENDNLRKTITERDATISKLNEQVWKVTTAGADEYTSLALDAQVNQTLSMVNGLKSDVQARDEKVKDLEGQVVKMNAVIAGQNKDKADLQREVEDVKRELSKQRDIAEAATKRAKEAKDVAGDQEKLIKRIMEENKRLVGVE